jgi:flagellar basal-body rod protein FlgB
LFESVTNNALVSALNGLSARQSAIADNIANVNTPNYHAKRVSFEAALAKSVADGSGLATVTTDISSAATNTNGNNVNLDTETLSNIDTVLRFQFASQAVNADFNSIRTALRSN